MTEKPSLLPATLVFMAVILVGGALVNLESKQHAAEQREATQRVLAGRAQALEQQLALMYDSAYALAAELRRRGRVPDRQTATTAGSSKAAHARFFVGEGRVIALDAKRHDETSVDELLRGSREHVREASEGAAPSLGMFRGHRGWVLFARAPATIAAAGTEDLRGWAVTCLELDELLRLGGVSGLAADGYEHQLLYREPGGRVERVISGLGSSKLSDPVHVPLTRGRLSLAIGPAEGWHSWARIVPHAAFVAIGALLATLLTYEFSRGPVRLGTEITTYKRRLDSANRRLMDEVQQRQELERQFNHADYHDAATGLPNRRYLVDRLEKSLRRARVQAGSRPAVIVLEFDRFELITNSLGLAWGNQLLAQAARRFDLCIRPQDVAVVNLGGAGMAVLLFDIPSSDAVVAAAERLQRALDEAFDLAGQSIVVTASMGVAISSSGLERVDELLREANIALSKAKSDGGARHVVFDPATRDAIADVMQRETDLRHAIAHRELLLHFQPIVSLETGRTVGMESLVRWRHPLEGLVPPNKFISLAEETGLIVPITRWVLKEACQQAQVWRERLPADAEFYLSVNISGHDMRQPDLCDFVAALLDETKLPPSFLRLEVTEGSMISNVSAASEIVTRLRALGVYAMLDDFGTGYSSLSYLQLFQFDYLKIDQSFVRQVNANRKNSDLVRAIVHMAGALGLKTVAEGTEDAETTTTLRELGCDYGQGYHFSRPVEGSVAIERLRSQYAVPSDAPLESDRTDCADGTR
ncbi:MAG: putative bifunctional diguanylate cyclase/phosphodiesterase [Gammaproteobacteria bacterium]